MEATRCILPPGPCCDIYPYDNTPTPTLTYMPANPKPAGVDSQAHPGDHQLLPWARCVHIDS